MQIALILANVFIHAFEEVYLKCIRMIRTKGYVGDNFPSPQLIVDICLFLSTTPFMRSTVASSWPFQQQHVLSYAFLSAFFKSKTIAACPNLA